MNNSNAPFLCVITPVFDPAYDSLCKLVEELQSQTYGDFWQIMISNGPSPRIKEFVTDISLNDRRFIYDEIAGEVIQSPIELLVNLGKRREYCLTKYHGARYAFLDADIKINDRDYFLKLHAAHQEIQRDVLITLTKIYHADKEIILPIFPIMLGHIDMANYTFSDYIAKNYHYPSDYDPQSGLGNDYRFFSRISNEDNTAILNFISTIRDGNNSYKRLTELFLENEARVTEQALENEARAAEEALENEARVTEEALENEAPQTEQALDNEPQATEQAVENETGTETHQIQEKNKAYSRFWKFFR